MSHEEYIKGIDFAITSGLTANELKAYKCFLLRNEITADEISDETKIGMQLVYQYLRKFIDKGLIIEVSKIKNKKTYSK